MVDFRDHKKALERQGFVLSPPPGIQFSDAVDGALFFSRQLENIEAKTYKVLYQELKYKSLFPVGTSIPKGAISSTYRAYDHAGKAKIIGSHAKDLPRVDLSGAETTNPVRWIGNSFGYSVMEIASAMFAGVPLDQMKANAARRVIEELFNSICFNGDANSGLKGFFTSGIPEATAPNGAGGTPQWSTKTADEILADINAMFSTVIVDTKEVEKADTLGVDTANFNLLHETRVPDTDMNLWRYILANSAYLAGPGNIVSVPEFAGAGTGGVDVAAVWTKDPNKVEFQIVEDITFHPVQQEGLEWVTNVTGITSGLHVRYPKSAYILEDV